jgi:glutamate-ammonia-ligase adenylyltransferase
VGGSPRLKQIFQEMRQSILSIERDGQKLKQDITEMRAKINQSKSPTEGDQRNLKSSKGCMVDIEFMVQYWVLLHANKVSSISIYSDNISVIKELFRLNLISSQQSQLVDIYQTYHRWLHRTVLQNNPAEIALEKIAAEVEHVNNCWNECFG